MKRVIFTTREHYVEAWMYLMRIGAGFTYNQFELWVEVHPETEEEDALTMERVEEIANSKTEDLLGYY